MFRKARRVNVRKRNDSEEEEREREEEQEQPPPLLLPLPGTGEEPGGPGGGDRVPAGESSLLGPGPPPPPPPSAITPGPGIEAGGGFPGGAEPGNGLKPRKRPRENKEVARASLLSFQDEEEGNRPRPGPPSPHAPPNLASRASKPACTSVPAPGLLLWPASSSSSWPPSCAWGCSPLWGWTRPSDAPRFFVGWLVCFFIIFQRDS